MLNESERRSLLMNVLVSPEMSNFSGQMHGGDLLKILDKVAYTCAMRWSGNYAVTLSVDKVLFKQPIHIGELLTFLAQVNYTGGSSMEVGIKVIAENMKTGKVRHTNSCYFTMVAIGDDKKPVKVPQYKPDTEADKERWNRAKLRRERNLEEAKAHK